MATTVKDVAKKTGVAISIVSRIINDHPSISESTEKKVRKVMDDLGYMPDMMARNLGKRISSTIDVISPSLDSKERLGNLFYSGIMKTINERARLYDMITATTTAKSFDVLLESVGRTHLQKQVGGLILVYLDSKDSVIDYLYKNSIPFALIDQPYQHETEIVYVGNDNRLLRRQAAEFLIENGHKNILFVANTTHESLHFERYFGYQRAMMIQGLTVLPSVALEKPENYMALDGILHQSNAMALVVIDDIFVLRAMQLAQIYGYQVPEVLSITSFNNSIFSTLTHPYLTNIDTDTPKLGRMTMKKLYELIHEELTNGIRLVIPHKLTKREIVTPTH